MRDVSLAKSFTETQTIVHCVRGITERFRARMIFVAGMNR